MPYGLPATVGAPNARMHQLTAYGAARSARHGMRRPTLQCAAHTRHGAHRQRTQWPGAVLGQSTWPYAEYSECPTPARNARHAGNALFLSDRVRRAAVSANEFVLIGDSAIATVGRLPLGNDGRAMDTVPLDTSIVRNHFHEIGVTGARAPCGGGGGGGGS